MNRRQICLIGTPPPLRCALERGRRACSHKLGEGGKGRGGSTPDGGDRRRDCGHLYFYRYVNPHPLLLVAGVADYGCSEARAGKPARFTNIGVFV